MEHCGIIQSTSSYTRLAHVQVIMEQYHGCESKATMYVNLWNLSFKISGLNIFAKSSDKT